MSLKSSKGPLKTLPPNEIIAHFGAFNINDLNEPNSFSLTPLRVDIHPDWNTNEMKYDSDIAVLTFKQDIVYSNLIQPICLSNSSNEFSHKRGVTVGWGFSEDNTLNYSSQPKELIVPIHNNDECFIRFPTLAQIASLKTFCAGSADGSGVCHGDSGNALVVTNQGISYLKGIVSSSLINVVGGHMQCDLYTYAIFTDVSKFSDWIQNIGKGLKKIIE